MGEKDEIISQILYEMVGNEGIKIINALATPSTDLQLEEKTNIPITRIRSTLNALHKYNIVSYNSARDEERGWFKYTWRLNEGAVELSVKNYLMAKLMRLKREFQEITQINFFKCENGCMRISFTEAYEVNFRCKKCNGVLKPVDSAKESREIKEEIEEIKRIIATLGPSPYNLKNVG